MLNKCHKSLEKCRASAQWPGQVQLPFSISCNIVRSHFFLWVCARACVCSTNCSVRVILCDTFAPKPQNVQMEFAQNAYNRVDWYINISLHTYKIYRKHIQYMYKFYSLSMRPLLTEYIQFHDFVAATVRRHFRIIEKHKWNCSEEKAMK